MNILSRCFRDIIKYWNDCRLQMGLVIIVVVLSALLLRLYQRKRGTGQALPVYLYRVFLYICDGVYVSYSYYVTFGMRYIGQRREVKWIPFAGVWDSPWEWPLLVENIMLFVPFGILLPLTVRRFRSLKAVMLSAGAVSILIEGFQYVFQCGKTEVDDCILNCLGALAGYVVYAVGKLLGDRLSFEKKEVV